MRQVKRWPAAAAAQRAADRATAQDDWLKLPSQTPCLVVQGLKDRVAPPQHGHAFREQLGSRVTLADVPNAGHMLFLEQPAPVADAVISFLRRQTA